MDQNKELLEILTECAAACEMCADACLDEKDIHMMVQCIRLDRDCAKICYTAASFVASNSQHAQHVIKECEEICRKCGEECAKHDHDHCKRCAEACGQCAESCRKYLGG